MKSKELEILEVLIQIKIEVQIRVIIKKIRWHLLKIWGKPRQLIFTKNRVEAFIEATFPNILIAQDNNK